MIVKIGLKTDAGFLALMLCAKFFYMFFAEFIYTIFTRLGDTPKYLSSSLDISYRTFISSTTLMKSTGSIFGMLPSPLYHIPLALLSYFGIKFFYIKLSKFGLIRGQKDRVIFFLFFFLPSVGVWSSIHSKEAVGVFIMCILSVSILNYLFIGKLYISVKEKLLLVISLYLLIIFKPQYLIALFTIFIVFIVFNFLKNRNFLKSLFIALIIITQLYLLSYFQPIIDLYAEGMYRHFDTGMAQSTRDNIFLKPGDFFTNAPYGMFISFFGPTLAESATSLSKSMAFMESSILLFLLFPIIRRPILELLNFKFNILNVSVLFFLIGWLLFVHYPFGIFNPGSALRYRTNFMPILVLVLFLFKYYRGPIFANTNVYAKF